MNLGETHSSYSSVEHALEAMCAMFPDSQIVQHMKLGRTKCMYICVYGLWIYFYSPFLTKGLASLYYPV